MGTIKEALREISFPAAFGGEDIDSNFRKILGHKIQRGGLGILKLLMSVEHA